MQKLTIKLKGKLSGKDEIDNLALLLNEKIPISFTEFLSAYSDSRVLENRYVFKKSLYIINDFLSLAEINGLTKEFVKEYNLKLIPFAMDPGGWHFCLSVDKETYGKILVNRWTDYSPEEQFLVIASSLEEFIDGLKTESQAGTNA